MASDETTRQSPARILFVDDDEDLQALFSRWCTGWGFEARAVTDPRKALETTHGFLPNLILLDMAMPGLGGYDVLELLKADAGLRRIPVVLLSATATSVPEKVGGLTRGAIDYLIKPLHKDEMQARINGYLRAQSQALEDAGERELDAVRKTSTFLNHSINNLLQTIQISAEWAAECDSENPEAVESYNLILSNVRAIAGIVQQLKRIKQYVTADYAKTELMLDLERSTQDTGDAD